MAHSGALQESSALFSGDSLYIATQKSGSHFSGLTQVSALLGIRGEEFRSLSPTQQNDIQKRFGDKALEELQCLAQEKDPRLFYQGLKVFALNLEDRGQLPAAASVYGFLEQAASDPELARSAGARLAAFRGEGSRALRAELAVHRLFEDSSPLALVAGFGIGSGLYRLTRLGAMAGVLSRPASFWTRGLMAESFAGAAGILVEGPGFVAGSKAAEQLLGRAPQWTLDAFAHEVAHAYMTLLPLKASAAAFGMLSNSYLQRAGAFTQLSRVALPQAAMVTGIFGGMVLQNAAGMKPFSSVEGWLWESAELYINYQMAGLWSRRALGVDFHRFELEMDAHAKAMATPKLNARLFDWGLGPELSLATSGGAPLDFGPKIFPGLMMASLGDSDNGNGGHRPGTSPEGIHVVRPVTSSDKDQTLLAPLDPVRPLAVSQAASAIGSILGGKYRVEKLLGEGGMGKVYSATNIEIGKKVVIKLLKPEVAIDAQNLERFINEAKAAAQIQNEHIIDIFDSGRTPTGEPFLVMEFLDGQPMDNISGSNKWVPVPRLIPIAKQIAEGLAAAHERGIVHRDLKPENIFLVRRQSNPDFVKILDFGIAKMPGADKATTRLTRAGAVFGTVLYMSPEQAGGNSVDHRSDIYSFGIMLYEMASGDVPFIADNMMKIISMHQYEPAKSLRKIPNLPQEIPEGLDAIILKCLTKLPSARYQSMREVISDLNKLELGQVPEAVTEMASARSKPWPLIGAVAGTGSLAVMAAAYFALRNSKDGSFSADGGAVPTSSAPAPSGSFGPNQKPVAIAVEPIDAHIFLAGKDLGISPVIVPVDKDGKAEIEIRREGYKPQTLVLDGSKDKESIRLEREPSPSVSITSLPKAPASGNGKKPAPVVRTPTAKGKAASSTNTVDPWD